MKEQRILGIVMLGSQVAENTNPGQLQVILATGEIIHTWETWMSDEEIHEGDYLPFTVRPLGKDRRQIRVNLPCVRHLGESLSMTVEEFQLFVAGTPTVMDGIYFWMSQVSSKKAKEAAEEEAKAAFLDQTAAHLVEKAENLLNF